MNKGTPRPQGPAIEVPPGAPLVRITAGAGSTGQKTWNLRRPITLIGSRRPASIILHDRNISAAHCAIVSTGAEVLLKDLHTGRGTFRNKERVDLTVLQDGDVIVVGETTIQVAIQVERDEADDSGCGVEFVDPTKFPAPVTLRLCDTDQAWQIEDAVAMIGRHGDAAVHLDNEAVSVRHALLFRLGGAPAIFDLSSRMSLTINGEQCTLARLSDGDRVAVGSCVLSVGSSDPAAVNMGSPTAQEPTGVEPNEASSSVKEHSSQPAAGEHESAAIPAGESLGTPNQLGLLGSLPSLDALNLGDDSGEALERIESQLGVLHNNIGESWKRLNSWESQLQQNATALNKQESDLAAREAELDAKDAALRGQLHDLTRYHEEIAARERELAEQLARIQAQQDSLKQAQAAYERHQAEIARRGEEQQRREHVLAQRWSRRLSATCPHCGKPVNLG